MEGAYIMFKKTHEQFLIDLESKNPNMYSQLKFLEKYKGDSVKIKAKDYYGEVWVTPSNILQGGGTSIRSAVDKTKYFIEKAKEIHGDKYDYSLTDYKNDSSKINIACKIHGVFEQVVSNHLQGLGCPYCSNRIALSGVSDIATTNPELLKFLHNTDDGAKYSKNSDKKVTCKCPDCGFEKEIRVCNLNNQGFSCNICSDGISIPEKFVSRILQSLNVEFKTQYSPNWANGKKYDFFVGGKNLIIETHGIQHYVDSSGYMRGLNEEQKNDELKHKLATSNGVNNYIVIDCRYSKFEFLSESVKESLSDVFDLSRLDLKKIYKESLDSKLVKACKLFKESKTLLEISKLLSLHENTIRSYIKTGKAIGLCG